MPETHPQTRATGDAETGSRPVRVRVAPSPTGPIHIGNMHTAFFNWLFARNTGGAFILRFEDTDRERSREDYERLIFEEMKWLGLDWDEGPDIGGPYGPYRQSERLDLYADYARRLEESGHVYPCYCTPEELAAERARAQEEGRAYKYSGRCRRLDDEGRARMAAEGRTPALRFAVPEGRVVVIDDLIRGRIEYPTDAISDFIIVRPSGMPLYNFAVVVDDITMRISHGSASSTRPWGRSGLSSDTWATFSCPAGRRWPSGRATPTWGCTANRATFPRPWSTSWPCWAGPRRTGGSFSTWTRLSRCFRSTA